MIDPRILNDIIQELERQEAKWGKQNHLPLYWIAVLVEEVGEVCQAVLKGDAENYREELIQVIAVAVAQLLSWDRNKTFGEE